MKKISNILWGLLFISIGVILILNIFEVIKFNIFFDGWWTLFIIVPSLVSWIENGIKISNTILLLLGVGLLLVYQNVITFDMLRRLILPVLLIIIGVVVILKNIFGDKIKDEIKRVEKTDKEIFTSFASHEYNFGNEKFLGANVDTVFGSAMINLKDIKLNSDVVVKVSTIFGKTEIIVPDNVNVKINSNNIFGSVNDKRKEKCKDSKNILYIDATSMFGGLVIDE